MSTSNAIQLNLALTVANGGYQDSVRVNTAFAQNNLAANEEVVSVPTTATSYSFPNVTTYGWMYLSNLDSTNYVLYGMSVSSTFEAFGKLEAGESAVFRLNPGITFQMQSNTAACNVWYWLLND